MGRTKDACCFFIRTHRAIAASGRMPRTGAATSNIQQVLPKQFGKSASPSPLVTTGRPKFTPKTPLRQSPPSSEIHPSLDRPHSPPQMASGSNQPFCLNTLSGPTHRHTDRPTDGTGSTLYYVDSERRAKNTARYRSISSPFLSSERVLYLSLHLPHLWYG